MFAYIRDGHGHAAHVNIPFYVDATNVMEAKSTSAAGH
jgi:hypothetical protein